MTSENQVFVLHTGNKAVPRAQFHYRDPSADACTIAFYFWLVLTPQGPVVVDCGFDAQEARSRRIADYRDRAGLLAACGVAPQDVKQVFMTHLHYDHFAGYELFPNATFAVQGRELEFWNGPGRRFPVFSASASIPALDGLPRLKADGRLNVVDGDWSVAPGIEALMLPGHTPGLQILKVATAAGDVLIASDVFHFYENLPARKPVQVTVDMLEAVMSMEAIDRLGARHPGLMLPGHDPDVARRFAAVAPGVVRVG